MPIKKQIKLGDKVKDIVTGFIGIAHSKSEFLNGCVQYAVRPKVKKDGEMPDGVFVDVEQLVKVDDGINKKTPVEKKSTGGAYRTAPISRF